MKPSQLSFHLRRIASAIDNSSRPSRALVAAEIQNVVRSLTSRRASKMVPGYKIDNKNLSQNNLKKQFPDDITGLPTIDVDALYEQLMSFGYANDIEIVTHPFENNGLLEFTELEPNAKDKFIENCKNPTPTGPLGYVLRVIGNSTLVETQVAVD